MTAVAQLLGYLLAVAGGTWLWGPWALVAGGVVLLVVPEIVEGVTRRGAAANTAGAARARRPGEH